MKKEIKDLEVQKEVATILIRVRKEVLKAVPRALRENRCKVGETFDLIFREQVLKAFDKGVRVE